MVKENIWKRNIKTDLQHFYDHEAKKYYETRKKFRKEGELILQMLQQFQPSTAKKKISILEFWCGSGRFASYLKEHYKGKVDYVGVDISKEVLNYAKKDNPKMKFICEDISEFVVRQQQESFDIIIGTSSFQHISTYRERLFLMKHFYRLLNYEGMLIMTNWSISKWFLKKHRKEVLTAFWNSLISLGNVSRRDIFVPRTNREKTFKRYYHLFGLKELKKLTLFSGLNVEVLGYLDEKANLSTDWKSSKNSFLVAKKSPILLQKGFDSVR